MNDERKGSFDCSLQGGEATAVLERLSVIREYQEPSSFSCLQETEAPAVLFEYYVSRQSFKGEDVPMEEANASPGDDASRRPGMAEADASERDSPQAAEDSARSSKQIMAHATGSVFSVAEQVSVCFYCGSTQYDIHDCQDPAKPMI